MDKVQDLRTFFVFLCDDVEEAITSSAEALSDGSAISKLLSYKKCAPIGAHEIANCSRGSILEIPGHPRYVIRYIDWDYISHNSSWLPGVVVEVK
jgi:hypothetical protein